MSAMRVNTVSSDSGSSRSEQYVRSSSLTRISLPTRNALQCGNFRGLALDVELLAVHPDQLAAAVVVVDADRQPVHAGLAGARLGAALVDGEPGEPAFGVDVEIGAQRVQAGGLEPLPAPAGQVAARGLLQRAEQVTERGIAECVVAEVIPQIRPGTPRARRRRPAA